jgi:nitroreductase
VNPLRLFTYPFSALEAAWTGHYHTQGSLKEADCVIGFSFGYRGKSKKITPGLSNHDLAEVALRQLPGLPKILQFEIADAFTEIGANDKAKVLRVEHHRQPGRYLDTREVAAQAQLLMRHYGWKTAALLAHPYHMPRVQLVCSRLGLDWVAIEGLRGAVEFDPASTQKWTRDLDHWRGYEPLALALYRMKGWV